MNRSWSAIIGYWLWWFVQPRQMTYAYLPDCHGNILLHKMLNKRFMSTKHSSWFESWTLRQIDGDMQSYHHNDECPQHYLDNRHLRICRPTTQSDHQSLYLPNKKAAVPESNIPDYSVWHKFIAKYLKEFRAGMVIHIKVYFTGIKTILLWYDTTHNEKLMMDFMSESQEICMTKSISFLV